MRETAVGRVLRDPLRPARVFRYVYVATAIGFLLAAIVIAVSAASAEREVVASADGPSLQLPDRAPSDLVLYGLGAGGARPSGDLRCTLDGGLRGISPALSLDEFTTAGQTLQLVGKVPAGWEAGATVDCPGLTRLVAVAGGGPGPRLAVAGLCLLAALGSAVMAVLGVTSQRARARRSHTP